MKRIMSVFAVVMALVATAASFSSCSKEENSSKNSLAGTTWVYSESIESVTVASIKISFPDDSNFKMSMEMLGQEAQSFSGTYVYDAPTVTLTAASLGTGTVVATVSGDKLTMPIDGVEGDAVTFTKQ